MLLHTVNQSPTDGNALHSCLRSLLPGAHLLLMEDGAYAAVAGSDAAELLAQRNDIHCHVIAADAAARGLTDRISPAITLASYEDFVRLSTECHAVQSWY